MAFPDSGPSTSTPQSTGSADQIKSITPVGAASQAPTYDPEKIVSEVDQKYANWRSMKRPHEVQWFINAAFLRGVQNIQWNEGLSQFEPTRVPKHKVRPSINKILPKYRQRKAKFLKTRATPIVVPATGDPEDKLDATASQAALEYSARKGGLESVYRQTLDMSLTYGKAFIWLYWDDNLPALVQGPNQQQVTVPNMGDVCYEIGSPFEVLVPDMGIQHMGDQPEIMRVRAVALDELKLRYKDSLGIQEMKGDTTATDLFQYEKQIASLSSKTNVGLTSSLADRADKDLNYVIRKEHMMKPCGKYPQGRYVVTAGGVVLKYQEMLPYGFGSMKNPYHGVEFIDVELAGQFWATSIVEQLIGVQREYNDLRQKLVNHMNKQVHPKVIVSVYSKWPDNAWNDEAGEVIKILTPPGIMEPKIVQPGAISTDLWNNLNIIRQEVDEISALPPVAIGDAGQTTSGFQVNLLQEATDSVHGPDIRAHELAHEELYRKARKMMAQGYDVPRLISIAGRAHIPDVMEFSQENIDENADVIVYSGSALSNSPAVRTQQVIELWNSGLLADDQNPAEGKRRALTMLDANGIGEFQEEKKRDEEKARLENLNIEKGGFVHPPLPFDDHQIHYTVHTDQMKSPEFSMMWQDQQQQELFAHTIYHMKFINPAAAIATAQELGLDALIPMLMPPPQPGQPAQDVPQEGQPPSGGPAPAEQQPQTQQSASVQQPVQ